MGARGGDSLACAGPDGVECALGEDAPFPFPFPLFPLPLGWLLPFWIPSVLDAAASAAAAERLF